MGGNGRRTHAMPKLIEGVDLSDENYGLEILKREIKKRQSSHSGGTEVPLRRTGHSETGTLQSSGRITRDRAGTGNATSSRIAISSSHFSSGMSSPPGTKIVSASHDARGDSSGDDPSAAERRSGSTAPSHQTLPLAAPPARPRD